MFDRSKCEPKQLILASLRAMARELDPALLSCDDAIGVLEFGADVERLGAAIKTIAAGRVAEGDAWRRAGDRSPADWLAKKTGTTVGEARGVLATGAALPDAPATNAALRSGALSARQAEAVAVAAAADPSSEQTLLDMAAHQSLQKLRDEAERVKAATDADAAARHERIRKARSFRSYERADGSHSGVLTGAAEDVALFRAAAQPFIDQRIDEARRAGEHEPSEAYAFDGFLAMARSTMIDACSGGAAASKARKARGHRGRKRLSERRELIALVDLAALRRGSLLPGETCEIPGVGPIPIETAIKEFGEAALRIVIRDGCDIATVVHTGRTANEVQATAVLVRQKGLCGRGTCGLPIGEIDHTDSDVPNGAAPLDRLLGLCGHCHDLKSSFGHTYRREADGAITWIRPDGTEERQRRPP
jgi:hypothetical protein